MLEKAGMTREGLLRMSRVYGGEAFDEAYFALIRPEWEAARGDPS